MGSVKEVKVINLAKTCNSGDGIFSFSDRYSVFDWGEMPDLIDRKGAALCTLAAYFFEVLEKHGIKSHFRGLMINNKSLSFSEISEPSDKMDVELLRVIKPMYNKELNRYAYSAYLNEDRNFLIPLEVIYRNKLPEGSSVFKRIKKGDITYKDLGLDHDPVPGEELSEPLLDVSTKLEHTDRYISWEEAQHISALTDEKMKEVKDLILKINTIITEECKKVGIENIDGKFEFGINSKGEVIVVDVLGTPDECRFVYDGFHISKEIARRYYRDTEWAKEAEDAKDNHGDDWKDHVKSKPSKLPEEFSTLLSQMYMSVTNEITGKKLFDTPDLKIIIEALKNYDK